MCKSYQNVTTVKNIQYIVQNSFPFFVVNRKKEEEFEGGMSV